MDNTASSVPKSDEQPAPLAKKRKITQVGLTTAPERDAIYYFQDGSCVFLVENTLFNIHRSVLSTDGSTFEGMFELPIPQDSGREGSSDSIPICLHNDTATQFRNFLWCLYALPAELSYISKPASTDIIKLLDITLLANKYTFKSTESWALDVIQDYLVSRGNPDTSASRDQILGGSEIENINLLERLIRVVHRCGRMNLITFTNTLLRQSWALSPRYIYCSMALADELNIHQLRGEAYYEMLKQDVVVVRRRQSSYGATFKEGDIDQEGRIAVNPAQQFRLLSGYRALSQIWHNAQSSTNGPDFAHTCATGMPDSCSARWKSNWAAACRDPNVTAIDPHDLIAKLKATQTAFERFVVDRMAGLGLPPSGSGVPIMNYHLPPPPIFGSNSLLGPSSAQIAMQYNVAYGWSNPCSVVAKSKIGEFIKSVERRLPEVFSVEFE